MKLSRTVYLPAVFSIYLGAAFLTAMPNAFALFGWGSSKKSTASPAQNNSVSSQTSSVAPTPFSSANNATPVVGVKESLTHHPANMNELVVADFDTGDKPNNLGGDFGSWNKDPNDNTQGCVISFETDDALGDPAGYSLKLDYDVDSSNPAYNGFWMKLGGQNLSEYNTLSFYVRGDGLNNFTKRIKLELKDSANQSSPYIVSGVTEKWQKIEVPLKKFNKIHDWSSMGEFVIVFDDVNSKPKQGTILIDQIAFEKK